MRSIFAVSPGEIVPVAIIAKQEITYANDFGFGFVRFGDEPQYRHHARADAGVA
jgi:hypothetical protein